MKKTQKITAVLLTAAFTAIMTTAVFAIEGSGTKRYPYLVTSESELQQIGTDLDAGAYYSLQNDITITAPRWIPIAKKSDGFSGNFEGNGHAISGLKIKDTETDYQGLFYSLNGSTVSNLRVENVDIEGHSYVGALTGYASSGSVVTGCSSSGIIYSEKGQYIGGLIGYNSCGVTNSSSSCTLQGSAVENVGGLIGYSSIESWNLGDAAIENCFFNGVINEIDGEYIGGLIGYSKGGSIISSYVKAEISADANRVGGLCGFYHNTISKSFFDGNITINSHGLKGESIGGIAGVGGGTIEQCYSKGMLISDGSGAAISDWYYYYNTRYNPDVKNCYSLLNIYAATSNFVIQPGDYYGQYTDAETSYYAGTAQNMAYVFNRVNKEAPSYFDSQVLGTTPSDTANGLKTAELKDKTSSKFYDWDFENIWDIDPAKNNGYPYLRNVVVPVVEVTGVTITSGAQIMRPGSERQLAAAVSPEDANRAVKWSSSDTNVVTVNASGTIKAVGEGTAVITAETEEKGYKATCNVTVTNDFVLGDLDGDGQVTAADSAYVLQKALVSTFKFPIE